MYSYLANGTLAYQVMPGNTIDNQTLRDFLTHIEKQYGKAKRLWLMERGIPTKKVLAEPNAERQPAAKLPAGRAARGKCGPASPPPAIW